MNKLILGNSLEKLKELEDNSIDSIVTDPPYELGFMGKSWDNTGIANNPDLWAECLRVLKPGGHLLAFSGTRTYHRMAVAIEDAGFEVRDMIEWVYGSGFSKCTVWKEGVKRSSESLNKENDLMVENNWDGWGRGGLKPSHEPICMARKPLSEKTVAQNVLKYGTGGINVDESRVGMSQEDKEMLDAKASINNNGVNFDVGESKAKGTATPANNLGRFPANLIHDNSEEVRECFPETSPSRPHRNKPSGTSTGTFGMGNNEAISTFNDSGSASRFFKSIIYQAKASKAERNKGCENLPTKQTTGGGGLTAELREDGSLETSSTGGKYGSIKAVSTNSHPTVKPVQLMEYLIKMFTPKGGTVLDPFMGSGSTGVAAKKNGYDFIGIDMTPEYIEIAKARINATEIK